MPLGGYTSGLHKPSMGVAILVSKTKDIPREVSIHVEPQVEMATHAPHIVARLSIPICSDRLWRWLLYIREKWNRHIRRK